ncbi:MAG: aldose 1-epimerase family protein [Bacteroidia bacterium]
MLELLNNDLAIAVKREGAELFSVCTVKDNVERLWQGEKEIWGRRAPVLFPFVGKLKNDQYAYLGKSYSMPQHGFARDREFKLIEKGGNKLVFELNDDEQSLKIFPFHFNLRIEYLLEEKKLTCNYIVNNPDKSPLYFSIGAHPGFQCSLADECSIEFEKTENVSRYLIREGLLSDQTETLLENSKKLPLTVSLFDRDAIVIKNLRSESLVLHSKFSSMKFSWYNSPYFGIWTKPGCDKFICLEPWAGIADNTASSGKLMEKEGIRKLGENEKFNCGFSMEFF